MSDEKKAVRFEATIEPGAFEGSKSHLRITSRGEGVTVMMVPSDIAEALRARLTGPTAKEETARVIDILVTQWDLYPEGSAAAKALWQTLELVRGSK